VISLNDIIISAQAVNQLHDNLDKIQELFQREGIKLTHQRLEIYKEMLGVKDHPSAEEVYTRIRPRLPTISLDTVYRTLDLFESVGLISRVEVLDDRSRFDPNMEPHHHLVCTSCKSIVDFLWPALDEIKPPPGIKGWGQIVSNHMELWGICGNCLKQGKKAKK
jgi:Fur family transcriptional regulator, peroxide stress response regulator